GQIFQAFVADNNGFFEKGWQGTEMYSQWWMDATRPYYNNDMKIRCCPLYANPDGANVWNMCWAFPTPSRPCPDYGSYGINGWVENVSLTIYGGSTNNWRTPNVRGAADVPLLFDEPWIDTWPRETNPPPEFEDEPWLGGDEMMMSRLCRNWHKNGCTNMLFLDFSARKVGLKELWTLKWHRKFDTCGPWTKCGGVQPTDWPLWMRDFKEY
ncbi:MAG: hypothetical protein WAK60_00560, partial [Sedimentisphaerales bacterium]